MTDETGHVTVAHRPARLSGTLAVVVATLTVALLAPGAIRPALVVEFVGLVGAAAGLGLVRDDRRLLGGLLVGAGCIGALGGVAYASMRAGSVPVLVSVLPGMLGVVAVAAAVAPVRGHGSRGLLKLGATGVLATTLVTALFHAAPLPTLLVATAGTVLTWDVGEQATNVGEQLGRSVRTRRAELVHLGASLLVAAVAVGVGYGLGTVPLPSLSLPALALVLVGALLLTAALHD